MSSRQLRKLQKQKELQQLSAQSPTEDDESSDDDKPAKKPRASIFSGFAALDGQDNDGDSDDNRDEKEDETVDPLTDTPAEPTSVDTSKNSAKKNKKKKKAKKQSSMSTKTEPPLQTGSDDIDQALQELELSKKKEQETNDEASPAKPYERICELLSINTHHLKVINEMRNLFGRDAITAAQNDEEEDQARSRRQRQGLIQQVDMETFLKAYPGKSLPEVTLRRNPFLAGKESWPRASTEGLTMSRVKEEQEATIPGVVEFCFTHDARYNTLEKEFFGLVQMYDPMRIVHFLHAHPYHISSLVQVSRIAKQDQNSALSADLCERALFTFGRVSLSAFRQKIEQGKARLSFNRPENRQFWLAGYHYLKNLIMKGTYRTALEWAKLLFAVDHSDPYGIIHFIHPLAIRAHESKWFIDLCDSEVLDNDPAIQCASYYIRQTLVLARLQQNDAAGAKALLAEGIQQLPWLYSHLFKALNLDVPKAVWGIQPRNRAEELHTDVYIHQTKTLWDNAQVISLLKETMNDAKRVDINDTMPIVPTVPINFARFTYLLEIPSLISLVPRELLNADANWEFDPLPPPIDENIFSHESQANPFHPPSREVQRGTGRPGNRQDLQEILVQATRLGAPEDLLQNVQAAILRTPEGDGVEDGDSGDEDAWIPPEVGVPMRGLYRTLAALLGRATDRANASSNVDPDNMPHIPGGFRDTEDEDGHNADADDETDNDMPGLI
ncbi:DUF654-domain-containing protein [Hypoxylon trugodes]|uniref:DUF654-domain-containing protein n=1 Tax=Hypoxylon trugodes TaxID=326681 RepID=UPI0021947A78|nr:DUF654-domain-containing protein [Hypoxylon trugodes]KAI1388200.1 DUF654-domain-containing protein [Hypoxylon trugodes]